MTNIRNLIASVAVSALLFTPIAACGSRTPSYFPPSAQRVCVGPETPDDLEDLFDRDVVVFPDSACYGNPSLYGFVDVSDAYYPVGAQVSPVYVSNYRSSHSSYLRSHSVNRVPGIATRSRISPPRPAPAPRAASPSRANTGPSAAKPAPRVSVPAAPKASVPSRSSSISRGGLGVNPAPKPPAASKPRTK